jgi:hypothetical protein
MTLNPYPQTAKVQIAYFAPRMAVYDIGFLFATMTNRMEAFVWLGDNLCGRNIGGNVLLDNFDSTKGEIRCYTESGYRRSPFGKVYFDRQIYTVGDTGCPFYLISL